MSLGEGLSVGFLVAATELGMASASRLYVEEIARARGRDAVEEARDVLGRQYPVFDFVASFWLDTGGVPAVVADAVRAELEGAKRVLVVGAEADALDALVPTLPDARIGLMVGGGGLEPDAVRFSANYGRRVEVVTLADWARWAGSRSALVTFVYGTDGHVAFVVPGYLRLVGPDVRAAFRSLVGWDLLGRPPRLHPRYLAETSVDDLSIIVGGEECA